MINVFDEFQQILFATQRHGSLLLWPSILLIFWEIPKRYKFLLSGSFFFCLRGVLRIHFALA